MQSSQPEALGARLLELFSVESRELVICAPFIKTPSLERVLKELPRSARCTVFTRWRPEEVAAGVSDTSILPLVEENGGTVFLCNALHAKLYCAGGRALVGSANVTATALGWRPRPNLELLVDVPRDTKSVVELESSLIVSSYPATAELAAEVERLARLIGPIPTSTDSSNGTTEHVSDWMPRLRAPQDLYVAYSNGLSKLSSGSAIAAAEDLTELELPLRLSEPVFNQLVASRIVSSDVVRALDSFVATPRRFGAVRDYLAETRQIEDDAAHTWQTLMRWLLYFMPDRYERTVPNHSEVFALRKPRSALDG